VTQVLQQIDDRDGRSSEELLPLLYAQLRNLARSLMNRYPPGNTLQPTALVHEAYLRLQPEMGPDWNGRAHFFGAAAQAMRRIMVDQARRKAAVKHGGDKKRVDLEPDEIPLETDGIDILDLNRALDDLQTLDPRKVEVVMLRYFAGLTMEETASSLGVSEATVARDWRFARLFLFERVAGANHES
jgi:RNA polymerase sigma factor (TIGR02999 family)